jgi:NAD(P)H-nitrite reductase large subunit
MGKFDVVNQEVQYNNMRIMLKSLLKASKQAREVMLHKTNWNDVELIEICRFNEAIIDTEKVLG